jgi:hypothetical protein
MKGGWRLEFKLFEAVDSEFPERIRLFDLQKLTSSLKLRKSCGIDAFQVNASGDYQYDHWYT